MHSIRSNHCHRHRFPIHPHPAGVQIFLALPATRPSLDLPHQSAFSSRPGSRSSACVPLFSASSLCQYRSQEDLSPFPMSPESLARKVLNPFGVGSQVDLWALIEMLLTQSPPALLQTGEAFVQGSSSAKPSFPNTRPPYPGSPCEASKPMWGSAQKQKRPTAQSTSVQTSRYSCRSMLAWISPVYGSISHPLLVPRTNMCEILIPQTSVIWFSEV